MSAELILRTDKEWSVFENSLCLVKALTPLPASRSDPYASVLIEEERGQRATGFITHRMDFEHLSAAFDERQEAEEVILVWTRNSLTRPARLVSRMMPKLEVWVCPPGAFRLMVDPTFMPELAGLDRHRASAPRVRWRPPVME